MKLIKKCVPLFVKQKLNTIKATFNKNVSVSKDVIISRNCFFEGYNSIYANTQFTDSYIGYGSYIANNSIIRKTKIGRFCAIGDNVRTYLGIHPTKDWVSIHPAFFSTMKQAGFTFTNKQLFEEHKYVDKEQKYVVEIGNDVWIGNNVSIMDGVTVGDGAVVAAGAVVTKDVEPYTIVGGIPCKEIRKRFHQDQINKLLEVKWWNWSIDEIKKNINSFQNIEQFLQINK